MARRKRGRPVNGILLLDKPVGLSSNHALQRARRLFDAQKAGHTGSLDPLASGLLPVCFGHATKVSAYLLDADKRYEVSARFGARTATGDAEGEIVEDGGHVPDEAALNAAIGGLVGPIDQVPPMYSALKHQGRRLYELAREGREVERPARRIEIFELKLLALEGPVARLEVHCSKGTYVRTLVEDLAAAAGTLAHVAALRRTQAGPFGADGMLTLEALADRAEQGVEALDRLLLPVDSALPHWPAVEIGDETAWYLLNGQAVSVPSAPAPGWVRLYGSNRRFLGMGEVTGDGQVAPRRLLR